MQKRAVVGIGTAALVAVAATKVRKALGAVPAETGTFANGMDYARWGDGPRTLVWIPVGPGSDVPRGTMGALTGSQFGAFLEAGFTVWLVTRKRNMAPGHTVSDMADDYAQLIADQFGGQVDVVVGVSYGGMIVQYLAAQHPGCAQHFVAALAAGTISTWGRDVHYRWAQARAAGQYKQAGEVMAEYFFPNPSQARLRTVFGKVLRGTFSDEVVPAGDLLVEAEAEMAFDAREVLPRISVPLLLISAEEDMFFTPQIVEESVSLIPDCTLIRYEGKGHVRAAMSGQLPRDIVEFADR